jgi:hypothetical protein
MAFNKVQSVLFANEIKDMGIVTKLERPKVQCGDSQIPPPIIMPSNGDRRGSKAQAVVVVVVEKRSCVLRRQAEVLKGCWQHQARRWTALPLCGLRTA